MNVFYEKRNFKRFSLISCFCSAKLHNQMYMQFNARIFASTAKALSLISLRFIFLSDLQNYVIKISCNLTPEYLYY